MPRRRALRMVKSSDESFLNYIWVNCYIIAEKRALCHNEQTAALLLNFGLGHILQYTSVVPQFQRLAFYSLLHNLRGCADRHTLLVIILLLCNCGYPTLHVFLCASRVDVRVIRSRGLRLLRMCRILFPHGVRHLPHAR